MIDAALGSGLRLVGGVVDCARALLGVGAGLVRPLVDLAAPLAKRAVEAPPEASRAGEVSGPQVEVEEAKYYLGPSREPERTVDRETGELPRAYGGDRIALLARDPWWAFAYWEVTPTTRVQALRALGAEAEGAREVLRVYDVTFITFAGDNAWRSLDVEPPPGADHWYLNLGRPGASFCAEIGLRTPEGRFLPLARSNVIATPRSSPSPDTSVRWVDLRLGTTREVAGDWNGGRLPTASVPEETSTSPDGRSRSSDVHAPAAR